MHITLRVTLAAGITLLALNAHAGDDLQGVTVDIHEWEVPWANTRPRDPYPAPDGTVWFVGQQGHYVAILDPENGDFRRIDLEDGAGPHTVIANPRGAWYAGNRADHIGFIDPESHAIEKFPLPGDGRRDPHTMAFTSDGNIWFTVQHGNKVGYFDSESGDMKLHEVSIAGARPYGIVVDTRDRPWFVLFGTNALGTVDSEGQIVEIALPREPSRPRRLGIGDDGEIWYVDYAAGHLGRYDPADGSLREWETPGGARSGPYAMGMDGEGRPWFVESGLSPNRFVGFDPASETFTEPVGVPSGGGTVRHMVFDDAVGGFWFGTDTNTIGRAVVKPVMKPQ